MQTLSIQFLGTGTSGGVPMITCDCPVCTSTNPKDKRLRSSILVCSNTTFFVIDTTPDFRYQMLRIQNKKLDAVLYTHPHKDHITGLDDIRAYNFLQHKKMPIYANEFTMSVLKQEYDYALQPKKDYGLPQLDLHTITQDAFFIGDIHIQPIQVWHHKMEVYGFRINNFTYITDVNKIDTAQKEKIKGTQILVLDSLRKEVSPSHFCLQESIDLSLEVGAPEVYFTHISHQMGLHDDIEKKLPTHIHLAYDGLRLSI